MTATGLEKPFSTITFADEYYSESSYLGDRDNSFKEDFIVGDRVWLNGIHPARIQFIGETHLGPGDDWAGLVLDQPIGKHDGQVNGRRYFYCENKKGVFARLSKLTRVPLRAQESPDSGLPSPTNNRLVTSPTSILKKNGRSSSASRPLNQLDNSFDTSYSYEYEYNSNRLRSTPIRTSSTNRSTSASNSFDFGYQDGYSSGFRSGYNAALKSSRPSSPVRSLSPIRPITSNSYHSTSNQQRNSRSAVRTRHEPSLQSPGVLRSLSRGRSKSRERTSSASRNVVHHPIQYDWEHVNDRALTVGRDGLHKSPYDRLEKKLEQTIQTSFDSGIEREDTIRPVDDPIVRKEVSYEHNCSRLAPKGRPNDLGRPGDVMERSELYEKYERTEVGEPQFSFSRKHPIRIESEFKHKPIESNRIIPTTFDYSDEGHSKENQSNRSTDSESVRIIEIELDSDLDKKTKPSIKFDSDFKETDDLNSLYAKVDKSSKKKVEPKKEESKHNSNDSNDSIDSISIDRDKKSLTGKVSQDLNETDPKQIETIEIKGKGPSSVKSIKIKPAHQVKSNKAIDHNSSSNQSIERIIPIERSDDKNSSGQSDEIELITSDRSDVNKSKVISLPRTSTALNDVSVSEIDKDCDVSYLIDETSHVIAPSPSATTSSQKTKKVALNENKSEEEKSDMSERSGKQTPEVNGDYELNRGRPILHVGDRVYVDSSRGLLPGVLKYLGPTRFRPGHWAGVHLDEPFGKNDGKVEGIRYFSSKPNYGIFAPCYRVHKAEGEKPNLLHRVTRFAKETLNTNKN